MNEAMLTKIRALLAKAERTDNAHEAETFTAKAVELMTRYAIDEATIRAGSHERPIITDRKVDIFGPYTLQKMTLFTVIADAHRCQVINVGINRNVMNLNGDRPKTLHIFGRGDDIEFVEMLFSSLLVQQAIEINRTPVPPSDSAKSFRTSFMQGYAMEIRSRLADIVASVETETSTALVLRNDKTAASDAMSEAYPSAQVVKRRVDTSKAGFGSGTVAGRRADLGNSRLGQRKAIR